MIGHVYAPGVTSGCVLGANQDDRRLCLPYLPVAASDGGEEKTKKEKKKNGDLEDVIGTRKGEGFCHRAGMRLVGRMDQLVAAGVYLSSDCAGGGCWGGKVFLGRDVAWLW